MNKLVWQRLITVALGGVLAAMAGCAATVSAATSGRNTPNVQGRVAKKRAFVRLILKQGAKKSTGQARCQ
jgi:hypothetical protein